MAMVPESEFRKPIFTDEPDVSTQDSFAAPPDDAAADELAGADPPSAPAFTLLPQADSTRTAAAPRIPTFVKLRRDLFTLTPSMAVEVWLCFASANPESGDDRSAGSRWGTGDPDVVVLVGPASLFTAP
jgi:hypothetical protein